MSAAEERLRGRQPDAFLRRESGPGTARSRGSARSHPARHGTAAPRRCDVGAQQQHSRAPNSPVRAVLSALQARFRIWEGAAFSFSHQGHSFRGGCDTGATFGGFSLHAVHFPAPMHPCCSSHLVFLAGCEETHHPDATGSQLSRCCMGKSSCLGEAPHTTPQDAHCPVPVVQGLSAGSQAGCLAQGK